MSFIGTPDYRHDSAAKIGVLLVNLGTPQAPTAAAVRPYLRRFLGDKRVVEAPRWLWWFILNGFILPFRPKRTAQLYEKIWQPAGSPLLLISQQQQLALQQKLVHTTGNTIRVALGMSYSEPSISTALRELQRNNCRHIAVLPLYPQYAGSTVGSVFNDVCAELSRWRAVPHLRFIAGYCDDERYIDALAHSISDFRRQHGDADKLVFSFHGTPLKMLTDGDPYHCLCHKTARLTAQKLQLKDEEWLVTFQSRFGKAVWLQPYTDATLQTLPQQGVRRVQMVSPAFAADCLETLEEIAGENRDIFMQAGGKSYDYIPALNDSEKHITFMHDLILETVGDWQAQIAGDDSEGRQERYKARRNAYPSYYDSE